MPEDLPFNPENQTDQIKPEFSIPELDSLGSSKSPKKSNKKVILIDDAMNTGSNLFDAIESLKKEGCKIVKIITLIDFCKSGYNKSKEDGYGVDYVFNLEDFGLELNKTYKYQKIDTLTEIKRGQGKEKILERLNKISENEIFDFKEHENLILAAYKEGSLYCFDQNI